MNQYFISCVIPAHNEEGNLPKLLEKLIPVLEDDSLIGDYEIIIVNDNSNDSTGPLIDSYSKVNLHIKAVHRSGTPGFGNAVKSGIELAKGEVIIPVMADLSDDPSDIPLLVRKIDEGYDIAYGSRFVNGSNLYQYPRLKRCANRLFNNSVRFLFGIPHKDITNAFKAYRKSVFDEIEIKDLEATGFDLTVEIPLKAHIFGFRSAEVPVHWSDRTEGEAKLKISQNGSVYGKRLIRLFVWGNFIALRDLFRSVLKGSWYGTLFALLVGLILLALIFTISGFSNVFYYIKNISIPWLIAGAISIIFTFVLRTWRWSVIFRSSGYVVPSDILFKSIMFGWFLNYLLPARLGDIARAVAVKITDGKPLGVTLSTIVVERAFDTITLAFLLVIASLFLSQKIFLWLEAGALVITMALIVLLWLVYRYDQFFLDHFAKYIPSLQGSLPLLKKGIYEMSRNITALILSFLISLIIWIFEIGGVYFAAKAIHYDIPFFYASIAGIAAFIAQSLPLTPAGIGVHEASIAGILALFDIPFSAGMAIALVDHFVRGLIIYILGIICTIHIAFASRWYFKTKRESFDFGKE